MAMNRPIDEQVIEFFGTLFDCIFSEPFRLGTKDLLRRKAVLRQVEEAADASSQSLTRFFLNEKLTEEQVSDILACFSPLCELIKVEDISNPNVTAESVAENLITKLPCPEIICQMGNEAVYRVALHSIVQVLMLIGPVMAEWQKLKFSSTFELPRRVVNRLNQISEQLDIFGRSGESAVDERFELSYRDYLLQRFHRVEAGTVRMTTNLDVDLRELFVMPHIVPGPVPGEKHNGESTAAGSFMDLASARKFYEERPIEPENEPSQKKSTAEKDRWIPALDQVKRYPLNVIVGLPGTGKSTFLEWLQVKLASLEEEFIMAGQQAIPLLLRVRQLDPLNLPHGAALIEKATASKDRATLMPPGWINRQMKKGRVLLMVDGLDETEPEIRDLYILPWLRDLCREYPNCRYLISSRPVGYTSGMLRKLQFMECDLLDFDNKQVREYTHHWCTAVRLARNESQEEARREGAADGDRIIQGFKDHPYIRNLARNPLMLSAICLVNYFEGGQLPKDRALLYKLCVEGLLHHWDQRRGIHSEFALDEKLRTCREIALSMQSDDRAEYEKEKVQQIFESVLNDPKRAQKLLEHIRYRTGLLLERRPNVFAFAHLTFQEYLAARAVHEGNRLGIDAERLIREHNDARWQEVIPLYSGIAPTPATRHIIENLIIQPDTASLSIVLAESYLSAGPDLTQDPALRRKVLERIAVSPASSIRFLPHYALGRFPVDEVAPIANQSLGKIGSNMGLSESHRWLLGHHEMLNFSLLMERIRNWRSMNPFQASELIHLIHRFAPDNMLAEVAIDADMYKAPGPNVGDMERYRSQAIVALIGLEIRGDEILPYSKGFDSALLQILRTLTKLGGLELSSEGISCSKAIFERIFKKQYLPNDSLTWQEFAALARLLAEKEKKTEQSAKKTESPYMRKVSHGDLNELISNLNSWAEFLENAILEKKR
jgi:hypothetical protein